MTLFGKRVRFGDLLVENGSITQEQLMKALQEQNIRKTRLGETLLALGYITIEEMANVLKMQLGIDWIDLKIEFVEEPALRLISAELMRKYHLLPFGFDKNNINILKVAMSDPMNIIAIDDIEMITNMEVKPYFASQTEITIRLEELFGKKQAMAAAEQFRIEHGDQLEEQEIEGNAEIDNAPIVKIVKSMLEQAIRQGASDIHIEPLERVLRIRYRIDGVLRSVMDYQMSLLQAMVARIKIISGLDIAEKRKPQDGRLSLRVDNREYDVRVSVLPTVLGEKIVLRLTSKEGLTKDKKYLGLSLADEKKLDNILLNTHGIILVTGPTGSGKSTTCYTVLNELNTENVNIITVEDPVEAKVNGVNQVQVNTKANLTFATALRSILRQDPDIIMIGEIRDGETASIAVKASITGHLVISTLHTNSTAASIIRLKDMGVEPYLIGDSVVGIIAQRLIRRLCVHCRKPREATEKEKAILWLPAGEDFTIYDGVGCSKCERIGYKGRIAIYEIMPITGKIRSEIHRETTADELTDIAIAEGMQTLRMSAARTVQEGTTSISEMVKVIYEMEG